MEPAEEEVDVLVVGCGPVGALVCALLRCYGVASVLCVERDACVYPHPRAVALDGGVIRLLGLASPALGAWVAQHVLPAALDVRSGPPGGGWGSFSVLGPFPPRAVPSAGGYPELSFFHQPSLEAELRRWAFGGGAGGARLVEGAEVSGLRALPCAACREAQGRAGGGAADAWAAARPACADCRVGALVAATAEAAGGAGAAPPPRSVRARWVIGCDGGSSGARRAAGIAYQGSSYPDEPWLVLDVHTTDAHTAHAWQCFNFVCHPARTYVHCPLPNAGRRYEFLLAPGEAPAHMLQPAVYTALLASVLGQPAAARCTVLRAVVYTFHARRAGAWRRGRLFLAGDAAHCMPPFRGQGLCSGFRDGAALAWRCAALLALARSSCAPPALDSEPLARSLADSYQSERLGHVTAVTNLSIQLGALISISRPAWLAHARNAAIAALNLCPPLQPYLLFPTGAPPTRQAEEGLFDFGALQEEAGGAGAGRQAQQSPFQML